MATRLETLRTRLALYAECEAKILDGAQYYAIGTRKLGRADLAEIAKTIRYLENEIAQEEARAAGGGRNRVVGIIPRDL